MDDKIIVMDDYRPHIVLNTEAAVRVYPLSFFQAFARGEKVEPLPDDVARLIVQQWLAMFDKQ